jgi:hypothetical protein
MGKNGNLDTVQNSFALMQSVSLFPPSGKLQQPPPLPAYMFTSTDS